MPSWATFFLGLLLLISSAHRCFGAALSTPWATLELLDKDRAISKKPWASYESSSVIGFHSTQAPLSAEAALDPTNYQISQGGTGAGGAAIGIVEASYRSRLLFLSLKATVNHPDPIAWGHHIFLRVAAPLSAGVYNVTASAAAFGQAFTVQLLVDEDKVLNENIHVNQVGYPINAPQKAVVGAWLGSKSAVAPFIHATLRLPGGDNSPFTVVNAVTGGVAFQGTAQVFGDGVPHEYFKQVAYRLDFSISTPGRYVIKVPGLGVSHAFTVSRDALRPALGAVARTFYGQRCGVALEQEYIAPWSRPEACHTDDAQVMEINPPPTWFQNKMPLPNPSNTTTLPPNPDTGSYFLPQAPGGARLKVVAGHHDAGDYGKYVVNSGSLVGWLMHALDILGAENDDLPLPEAGDGIPDIVQIVQHELKFLEGMQDGDGGVYCVVKPNTTAGEYYEDHLPCGTPGKDQCNFAADSPVRGARIAWPKDTTCTAQFAGALARAARSPWVKTFYPSDAARYLSKAIKAWDFLATKAPFGSLCYHFYGCMGAITAAETNPPGWWKSYSCFDPQGDQSHDERVWAAVELYAATGESKYHDYFLQRHCPRYRRWGWVMLPFSYGLATVTYAHLAVQAKAVNSSLQVNASMATKCLDELVATGQGFTQGAQASPYYLAVPERSFAVYGYGWQFQASVAAQMLFAAQLAARNGSEASQWRDMAAMQVNYVMGVNPQGYSLITGLGARRVTNPVDSDSVYDDLDAPWPGQLIGLSGGFSWINQYGSAVGKTFPGGSDYAVFDRIADGFNVNTEYTVPEMALALAALAVLSGQTKTPLPAKPTLTVQQSVSSGAAPLTVNFQLSVSGSPDDVASLEIDFGDGATSYQASVDHTYLEPGRVFSGFAIVVDTRGQTTTQKFTVSTSFPANATKSLASPSDLQLVARVDRSSSSGSGSSVPPLLATGAMLVSGSNSTLSVSVPAVLSGGMAAAQDNLAWLGPQDTWTGVALRPVRFEDVATYSIDTASSQALQAILTAASGGLVLDFWLYPNNFLSYGRDNVPLVALVGKGGALFGLQGAKWAGNQLVAGNLGVVANSTVMQPALTLGRWHFLRLAVSQGRNGTGVCSAVVDGVLVATQDCQLNKILSFCGSSGQSLKLVVGGLDGYVDDVRVYASPKGDLSTICGPSAPPPPPSPSPAPRPLPNVFSPYVVNAATMAVMNADGSCGLSGSSVNSSLPLRLYSYGSPTGAVLAPYAATYLPGLSTGNSNTSTWGVNASGCSLRVGSEAVAGGNAGLVWRLPKALLAPALYTNAFTVEAKVFVEDWRAGYSKWNSVVLGISCNWDTYMQATNDMWQGPSVLLSTPSASTTGAFAGKLTNATVVEAVINPGTWHHVALSANTTTCVLSVDGAAVASGKCEAKSLLWQTSLDVSIGGFVGWVDDLALSADARTSQVPNTTNYVVPPPPPLPPVPSPSPAPPTPPVKLANKFTPLVADAATIGVMNADTVCGLSGSAVGSSLPLVMYASGQPTGTVLLPSSAVYTPGLNVSANNTAWAMTPSGCSLRVASEAVASGNALVNWKLPLSTLQPAVTANAFTVEAKIFVEVWRIGYSKFNSDVLGSACNWDTSFKITHDIWKGPALPLSTPSASTTGAFAGTLANSTVIESAISTGVWHHVALSANSTTCVFSVDGAAVASGKCEAKKLIWQTATTISVGGFVGWVDELAVSAAARTTQVPTRVPLR